MGEAPTHRPATARRHHSDAMTVTIAIAVVVLLVIAGNGRAPSSDAAPPPIGGFSHGAAGSGRNGFGGVIAPSPTMRSWPGTGAGANGGPFAFVGAHYGSLWQVPAASNNASGVGYCVMEDVAGEGPVSLQPDPAEWDAGEMARAAALMSSFGGDRVVPYGIDASGPYDVASGEWSHPSLLGGGEYTRRRHVAVNFGVKMFLEDVSPTGAGAGLKLARDTSVVNGSGGEFSALSNGYAMAAHLAHVADVQHAIDQIRLQMVWATTDGAPPTLPGTYALEVRAADATGKPVGYVPIVMLSDIGIDGARTVGATATVDRTRNSADDEARWTAAAALGWPTMDMAGSMVVDPRFALLAHPSGAAVADMSGVARFTVTVIGDAWELAFHTQAPTADVDLHAGTGIQGQVTWTGAPQSASIHVGVTPSPPPAAPLGGFAVRKVLEAPDVQGSRDMSGFEFDVSAANGTSIGRLTTAADGQTPPIEALAGTYTIREIAGPPWATTLGDGGPVTFAFDPTDGGEVRTITYTNTVPAATIATTARDGADSDQVIELHRGDAMIIDTVTYAGLVPGTGYVVTGELMVRSDNSADDAVAGAGAETGAGAGAGAGMIATGITGSTPFVATGTGGSVDVEFAVPANSPLLGHTVVIYEQLAIASSGRVIATHADPADPAQTIDFAGPAPTTTIPTTTIPTTTIPTTTIPTTTIPTTTIPATTIPATTIPATTIPDGTSPPATADVASDPPALPSAAPPTATTPPARPATLPRTGADGSRSLAIAALTLVLLGIALVSITGVTGPTWALRPHGVVRRRTGSRRNRAAGSTPPRRASGSVGHQGDGETEPDVGTDRRDPPPGLDSILGR